MLHHELYQVIDDQEKHKVIASLKRLDLKKGDFVFWENEPAHYVYYVKSGHVKVFKVSEDGQETIFDIYNPNSFVAVGVLFNEPQVYPASASVIGDTILYAIPVHVLEDAIVAKPESARAWIRYMNQRLTFVQRRLSQQIFADSQVRFKRLISYLANKYPTKEEGDYLLVSIPITKQELAELLNIRRETLSRMLSKLKEEKACIIKNKQVAVLKQWLMGE
ncbi:MAG TPA: Crp/Fnr family transcriptional regulator [Haloplasmataceae bacterium]